MSNLTLADHTKHLTSAIYSSLPSSMTTINLTSNPSTWTINQVEEWLIKNSFNDCIDILCRQYHIDGQRLINLNKTDILSLTNNKQLWIQIKILKQSHLYKKRQSTSSLQIPIPFRSFQTLTPIQSSSTIIPLERTTYTSPDRIEDQLTTTCCFISSIRSDRKKTLSAFFLALITVYFCSFIITIVDERLPDPKNFPPLPDLILDNIKQIPWAFAVTEKLIVIEMLTLMTVILLHRHRLIEILK
jgi:hypothetical protein